MVGDNDEEERDSAVNITGKIDIKRRKKNRFRTGTVGNLFSGEDTGVKILFMSTMHNIRRNFIVESNARTDAVAELE